MTAPEPHVPAADVSDKADKPGVSRRRALARLGLAAGVAYAAPTITTLERRAYAAPTPCPPRWQKGKKPPHCR